MTKRLIVALTAWTLACGVAQAATVSEDFSSGLGAFTLGATSSIGTGIDPTPFIGVGDNGGDPYLEMTAGFDSSGLGTARASLDVFIDASTALFSFDFGVTQAVDEPCVVISACATPDVLKDEMLVSIGDGTTFENRFAQVTEDGAVADPLAGTPVAFFSAMTSVDLITASDPFFDTGVAVDLTPWIGTTVTIQIVVNSFADNRAVTFGIDNLAFSPITAVPGPAALPLMLGGLTVLGLIRRRLRHPA